MLQDTSIHLKNMKIYSPGKSSCNPSTPISSSSTCTNAHWDRAWLAGLTYGWQCSWICVIVWCTVHYICGEMSLRQRYNNYLVQLCSSANNTCNTCNTCNKCNLRMWSRHNNVIKNIVTYLDEQQRHRNGHQHLFKVNEKNVRNRRNYTPQVIPTMSAPKLTTHANTTIDVPAHCNCMGTRLAIERDRTCEKRCPRRTSTDGQICRPVVCVCGMCVYILC